MNKEIFLDGVEYISASQAAKKIGYASDYIGQLCRGGKIAAKLIGRTWYVDYSSILQHKKNLKSRKKNFQIKPISKSNIGDGTRFVASQAKEETIKKDIPVPEDKPSPKPVRLPESRPAETPIYPKFASYKGSSTPKGKKTISGVSKIILVGAVVVVFVLGLSTLVTGTPNPGKLAFSLFSLFSKPKPVATTQQQMGIVVTPDSSDHASLVERIKGFFSDNVQVTFDQDSDTGVITPVFHQGDDSQHYAFVMVPISQAQ